MEAHKHPTAINTQKQTSTTNKHDDADDRIDPDDDDDVDECL